MKLSWKGAIVLTAATAIATFLVTALLVNIFERKSEARNPYVLLEQVGEDDTDPAKWGVNWPREYDSYKRTAITTRTRFGGHGGSEALPAEKIERDPWLKRMFLGYAFSIDYRDRRGHAYMLADQEQTERLTKPQSGSCLHCHASVMPLYRTLGNGDAMQGFEESYKFTYKELNQKLHDSGHAHPVSCVDCHTPKTMQLRVTRPGFLVGIRALAESDAPVPHLPSIEQWRQGPRSQPYDPNEDGTRTEMRSFVCGQCHVEYYCATKRPLTFRGGRVSRRRTSRPSGTACGSKTGRGSSITPMRRVGPRSSRRSTRSSSSGARGSMHAATSLAPTVTCPTCVKAPPRSRITGSGARS